MTYDFIVVGSGVSGGKIAHDLCAAGAKVLLLEAGKAYQAQDFPLPEIDASARLFWGGGLEVSADARLGLLRARCLGGTSVVNQALLDPFDEQVFDDWRARTGISTLGLAALEPYYSTVLSELSATKIESRYQNRNARLFTQAFERLGYSWEPLLRAQKDCALGEKPGEGSDCIACLGGCPRSSKQSTLATYIPRAERQGLEIRTDFEVTRIHATREDVRVQGIHVTAPVEARAKRLVLCAGALGNTTLLLRSGYGRKLPALGKGFSCHPQFMTYGRFSEPVDAHKGAFQSVKSKDPKIRRRGYKFENVYAPPIGTAMLMPGSGREHLLRMAAYRHYASMEICVRDEPNGIVQITRAGKMIVHKPLTDSDRAKIREGSQLIRELFESVGALEVVECRQGFGLHLMGGCAIGTDPKTSVIGPDFRLHGEPRVYAADSSIFPSAPGINPSFTIFAISSMAARSMLGESGA